MLDDPLDRLIESFNEAVGLGVIGSGELLVDPQLLAELPEDLGRELRALVTQNAFGDSMARDDFVEKCLGRTSGRRLGQGPGLGPAGPVIAHDECVLLAIASAWHRADEVEANSLER